MTYTEDRSDPLRAAAQDIMDQAYQILGDIVPEIPFEVRISLTTFGREVKLVQQINWPAHDCRAQLDRDLYEILVEESITEDDGK